MSGVYVPSVAQVNALINAPGARPDTVPAHVTHLDATRLLSEPCNLALAYVGGCAVFEHLGGGSYEGHMFAQPGYRGRAALEFGRAALKWLFNEAFAARLIVMAPNALPQVRVYCKRLGMESLGKDLFLEHFQTEAVQWAA